MTRLRSKCQGACAGPTGLSKADSWVHQVGGAEQRMLAAAAANTLCFASMAKGMRRNGGMAQRKRADMYSPLDASECTAGAGGQRGGTRQRRAARALPASRPHARPSRASDQISRRGCSRRDGATVMDVTYGQDGNIARILNRIVDSSGSARIRRLPLSCWIAPQ